MPSSLERFPALASLLKGAPEDWSALHITEDEMMGLCEAEDLSALIFQRLSASSRADTWPAAITAALARAARAQAGEELLRGHEVREVLGLLLASGVQAILMKGTALAYSVYESPASRPRGDTDLLVRSADVDAARRVFASREYVTTVHCNDLFSQFEVQKTDGFGVRHVFDVHWKISTQPVFADAWGYEELRSRAQAVPLLGDKALAPGPLDALLLACIHPVMHHRNVERALWIYDVHLLASRLDPGSFEQWVQLARDKQIASVCARQLRLARSVFETPIPEGVLERLSAPGHLEPSAEYLAPARRWHDELLSSVRGLPSLRDRARLLREVLFPSPRYMLGAYGLSGKPLGNLLLPALYVHRQVRGAWKILAGKK